MSRRDWLNILGLMTVLTLVATALFAGAGPTAGAVESGAIGADAVARAPFAAVQQESSCRARTKDKGKICGKVLNGLGTPIEGAKVEGLARTTTGRNRTVYSGASGKYELNLDPGEYALRISYTPSDGRPKCIEYYKDVIGGPLVPEGATSFVVVKKQAQGGVDAVLNCGTPIVSPPTVPPATPAVTVTVVSDCARIDWNIDHSIFSVCALWDIRDATAKVPPAQTYTPIPIPNESPTPTPRGTPESLQCPIEISVDIPCVTQKEKVRLLISPPGPNGADVMATSCGPSSLDPNVTTCHFTVDSEKYFNHKQVHTVALNYLCGTSAHKVTLGYTGFCDPKGHIGERPHAIGPGEETIPTPTVALAGALVTLHYVNVSPTLQPDTLGPPQATIDCRILETRPTTTPMPLSAEGNHWNYWSTLPTAVPSTLATAGPAQLGVMTPVATTTTDGMYGFLTMPGYCYVVKVEPASGGVVPLATAYSPMVGNAAAVGRGPVPLPVEDLDLTYYYK